MKKSVVIFLIIILTLNLFCTNPIFAKNKEKIEVKSEALINKELNNNKHSEETKANYSEAYKKWLELSEVEKEKLGVVPRKYNISLKSIYDDTIKVKEKPSLFNLFGLLSEEKLVSTYADEIPEEFDLRDKINIPVENQKSDGLCWAFASLTSLETNLAMNGYGENDYSERHIDYLTSIAFGGKRFLGQGGNFEYFLEYVSQNDGPVLEETVPYDNSYSIDEYKYLDSLESQAYVTKKIDFPTIDKYNLTYTEEELKLFRDKVKKHIMENGSIYVNIFSQIIREVITDVIDGEAIYNYTLYNTNMLSDHAVSVIGWDDNYPKENFADIEGNMPQKNGAYIAVNSWGDEARIVYISYEDISVEMEMSGIVSATTDITEVGTIVATFEEEILYNYMKETYFKAITDFNDQTKTITVLDYLSTLGIELYMPLSDITDLSGLEQFNFEYITLSSNNIEDINVLANMKELKGLDLRSNKVTDLNGLENLTNLDYLDLSINYISNSSGLENLTNLAYLDLSNNYISNPSGLENLINLVYLDLNSNNISDISKLENVTNLAYLDLSNNYISNLSGLENLINLVYLDLNSNNISDISKLADLTNLEDLYLEINNITNLSGLENLTKLTYLDLGSNNITDSIRLENLKNLIYLDLNSNNISDISKLESLTNLEYLNLGNNNISDISKLATLTNLSQLDLSNNNVSDISKLGTLEKVEFLYLNNNNVIDISSLATLVNLWALDLSNNYITDINTLSDLKELSYLNLRNNSITDISPLAGLIYLWDLDLGNNNITDINALEDLEDLYMLNLSNNSIKDISVLYNLLDLSMIDLSNNIINEKLTANEEQIIKISLPNIIKEAQNPESIVYSNKGFELQNCNLSADKNYIEVDTSKYEKASLMINSGLAEGTIFNITIENNVTGIKINILPKTIYQKGDNLDLTGGTIIVTNKDGSTEEIVMNNSAVTITGYDKDTLGTQLITVQYRGKTATFEVEVKGIKSNKLKIIEDGDNSIIRGISPNINSLSFKQEIQSTVSFNILDLNGNAVSDTSKIGTGYKLKLEDGKVYTLIIKGDLNGNGEISLNEVVQAAKVAVGITIQEGNLKFQAMDTTGNGKINVSDVAEIARLKIQ